MERSSQQRAASPPKSEAKPLDHVEEAGKESFPASDPPAHWAGKDRPPLMNGEEVDEEGAEELQEELEDEDEH